MISLWPAFCRFDAMPAPMVPTPMNPTCMCSSRIESDRQLAPLSKRVNGTTRATLSHHIRGDRMAISDWWRALWRPTAQPPLAPAAHPDIAQHVALAEEATERMVDARDPT